MFGIGGTELIIILIFVFLIFGPDRLPGMAKTVGNFLRKFQDTRQQVNKVMKEDFFDLNNEENPIKNPTEAIDKLSNIAKDTIKDVTHNQQNIEHIKDSLKDNRLSIIAKSAIAEREKNEIFSKKDKKKESEL